MTGVFSIEGELHTKPRPRELNCSDGQVVSKEFTFQDGGKIDVNVTYKLQTPKCTNTIVTDRFKYVWPRESRSPRLQVQVRLWISVTSASVYAHKRCFEQ